MSGMAPAFDANELHASARTQCASCDFWITFRHFSSTAAVDGACAEPAQDSLCVWGCLTRVGRGTGTVSGTPLKAFLAQEIIVLRMAIYKTPDCWRNGRGKANEATIFKFK